MLFHIHFMFDGHLIYDSFTFVLRGHLLYVGLIGVKMYSVTVVMIVIEF